MLDSCSSIRTPDNLYNVLTHNFIRHYEQNRFVGDDKFDWGVSYGIGLGILKFL